MICYLAILRKRDFFGMMSEVKWPFKKVNRDLKLKNQKLTAWITCAMVKSRYIGDGHPTFSRNPYNGYINPYYWVDDHPLLYGHNGSLDPGTPGCWIWIISKFNNGCLGSFNHFPSKNKNHPDETTISKWTFQVTVVGVWATHLKNNMLVKLDHLFNVRSEND